LKCRWAKQFSRPQIALAAGRMQKANLDYNQYGYQAVQGLLGRWEWFVPGRWYLVACCPAIKIK